MFVKDSTIQAEGLSNWFESLGKSSTGAVKELATNVLKNSVGPLEKTSEKDSAVVSKKPKAILSELVNVTNIYQTAKGFIFENLYSFN